MREEEQWASGQQIKLTWINDSEGVGKNYVNCSQAQVITGINIEIRLENDWIILWASKVLAGNQVKQ